MHRRVHLVGAVVERGDVPRCGLHVRGDELARRHGATALLGESEDRRVHRADGCEHAVLVLGGGIGGRVPPQRLGRRVRAPVRVLPDAGDDGGVVRGVHRGEDSCSVDRGDDEGALWPAAGKHRCARARLQTRDREACVVRDDDVGGDVGRHRARAGLSVVADRGGGEAASGGHGCGGCRARRVPSSLFCSRRGVSDLLHSSHVPLE